MKIAFSFLMLSGVMSFGTAYGACLCESTDSQGNCTAQVCEDVPADEPVVVDGGPFRSRLVIAKPMSFGCMCESYDSQGNCTAQICEDVPADEPVDVDGGP